MRSMEIERRRLLSAIGLGGLAAGLGAHRLALGVTATGGDGAPAAASPDDVLYLAARKNGGCYEAALFDETARDRLVVPLPGRGHSFAIDAKRRRAVAFGRQPGFFAVAMGFDQGEEPLVLEAEAGRHFYGHGVYAPDGGRLYATENDYETGRGLVGVYDCRPGRGYRRIGEHSTAGVGPHEAVLLPDGRTLCVANGGILTHPDYGKLQLNAESMRPSLAYLDLVSGELLEQVFLDDALNRLSIRHLVVDGAGGVWFGCQYTGPQADHPPLVGRHRRGEPATLFQGPVDTLRAMRNYIGSLAYDRGSNVVATTSPVGGMVAFWDAESGQCLGSCPVFDGCGVAAAPDNGFLVSSGDGGLRRIMADGSFIASEPIARALAWDNHLRRFTLRAAPG
jgi:hypothetical protein